MGNGGVNGRAGTCILFVNQSDFCIVKLGLAQFPLQIVHETGESALAARGVFLVQRRLAALEVVGASHDSGAIKVATCLYVKSGRRWHDQGGELSRACKLEEELMVKLGAHGQRSFLWRTVNWRFLPNAMTAAAMKRGNRKAGDGKTRSRL